MSFRLGPTLPALFRLNVIATAVTLVLANPVAYAVGLGSPANTPVIGQPLRLDIPLTVSPGEMLPTSDCVRMTPPGDAPDRQFFPRNARAVIEGGSRPRVRIVSPDAVTEPLIEFRLTVGCGNSFARDFLVLTDSPHAMPTQQVPAPSSEPRSGTADTRLPAAPETNTGKPTEIRATMRVPNVAPESITTLKLSRDSNLNTLARIRYPSNQSTRDEYRRLMAAANPALFAGAARVGSVPLPAGTVLSIPPNLPPPESELSEPTPEAAATKTPPPKPAPTGPSADKSTGAAISARNQPKDRLVIGGEGTGNFKGPKPLSPQELASAMDRLERMLEDQGRTEHEMISNLETLNSAFIEVKNYVQSLEKHMKQLEQTQHALQTRVDNRPEPKSLGVLELLLLILASGATGAGLIVMNHRLQLKRMTAGREEMTSPDIENDAPPVASIGNPPPPAPVPAPPTVTSATKSAPSPVAFPTPTPQNSDHPNKAFPVSVSVQAPAPAVTSAPVPLIDTPPAKASDTRDQSSAIEAHPVVAQQPPAPPVSLELPTPGLDAPLAHDPALETPLEFTLPDFELEVHAGASAEVPEVQEPTISSLNIPLDLPPSSPQRQGDDAVELAEIMTSMGLGKEAARTLVEHILADPKRDLAPWLKALDIYRKTGQREEFEWLADNLRLHLNVKPDDWENDDSEHRSLIEYRHLAKRLISVWPQAECAEYLEELLRDNREGVRQGFPQSVAEEIVLLQRILRDDYGVST